MLLVVVACYYVCTSKVSDCTFALKLVRYHLTLWDESAVSATSASVQPYDARVITTSK